MSEVIRLALYESRPIVELAVRPAGVYEQKLALEGNSLLSTVFVESITPGATLQVEYHDAGVGQDEGEDLLVGSHPTLSTSGMSSRQVLAPFHNKPWVVCRVTGGSARFGVYITVVQQLAVDLKELAGAVAANEVILNENPGVPVTLITTPTSGTWQVRYAEVVCSGYTRWQLFIDEQLVAGGATGPERRKDRTSLPGMIEATAKVELKVTYDYGPNAMPCAAYVGYTSR